MTSAPLPETIADLRELLAKVTPGPWKAEGSIYEHMIAEIVGRRGIAQVWSTPTGYDDARLIVAAINALPALLTAAARGVESEAEIAALKAEIGRLRNGS